MEVEAEAQERPRDEDIMAHHQAVCQEGTCKSEFVGDKEPLSVLAAEYELGNPVFKAKIEQLGKTYGAIRRTRGDGNCFFRSFMFAYLEHVLEAEDEREAARVLQNVEQCRNALVSLGYAEFTFEDFLAIFVEQVENALPGKPTSMSIGTLVERCRDQYISNYGMLGFTLLRHYHHHAGVVVIMFFRFVTSSEIRRRAEFFEPFILGISSTTVDQFCKSSVEPMGEESDHVHIIALTDALGVPVRVVYLDRSICDNGKTTDVNHHDFIPGGADAEEQRCENPHVVLLYRPGHYDILYRK
ncbi:ubiquitin thioesterase otubain-like isoform X1 [Selaginella moellendorffii]|uniref:ubiquitin thioesterase otubain-like isoform X1 n=1 Tax=Selaginella moellendorffii TaxID=88036 RepID=UPI000D1CBF05|nr:ubiquitin thioesterase otubain-like isoform X1 [Selaginella moellendorffii]|eukprot:XP_024542242.1 ubiquitin thioesterase otubain-like isoform X1 [Selaginella moellendorffii]